MDEKNIFNTFELFLPVIRVGKAGNPKAMRDLFDKQVVHNFHKHDAGYTLCGPILEPLLMLLSLYAGDCDSRKVQDVATWLTTRESVVMDDFLDNLYSRLGWAPNSMVAELCLLVAK